MLPVNHLKIAIYKGYCNPTSSFEAKKNAIKRVIEDTKKIKELPC